MLNGSVKTGRSHRLLMEAKALDTIGLEKTTLLELYNSALGLNQWFITDRKKLIQIIKCNYKIK